MINKTLLYVAAFCSAIAGILHLILVPMYFSIMPTNVSVFFIISGIAQLFWVIPVIKQWSNFWYYIGIGGTIILIILWIVAVPAKGLEVSANEIAIELFQVVFIILSVMIVRDRTKRIDKKI